jgi:NAD(P)-dependent dehydrogenase (short-subunit alcohol dehydrogenase family)
MARLPTLHALVTGANRGLGLEVTRQLAARGFTVFAGARDPDAVPRSEGDVRPVALDVTDSDSVAALRARLVELDVLVNNAAVGGSGSALVLDADVDDARAVIEVNTFGAWRVASAMADLLRASTHGRIVNVSSSVASLASMQDAGPSYLLSKVGLNAVTRMLADALGADGVLVNAVCPGWIATDMGGPGGRPVEAGASSVVWAATLPDDGPTGGFFEGEGIPIPW